MVEFHNYTAGIDYPFVAGKEAYVGANVVPHDVFVDAGIVVYSKQTDIRIDRIAISKPYATVTLQILGGNLTFKCSADGVYTAESPAASGYLVLGAGAFDFFNRLSNGAEYKCKNMVFEPALIQNLDGYCVNSIDVYNGDELSAEGMVGDIRFVAGAGVRTGIDYDTNTINIVSDKDLGIPCYPLTTIYDSCDDYILAINNAVPDRQGDISVTGGPGVRVTNYPELHKIVIDFTKAFTEGDCEV